MRSLGTILKAAILAGLIASVAASIFHLVLAEPIIERAIELEEQRGRESGAPPEEPVVSRPVQKVGLVVGLLLYGAVWGLLVGVAYRLLEPWVEARSLARRGAIVAGLLGWSVALLPFLKYPANPPGVGDPGTIGYRQALYFGFIALSIAGTVLAIGLRRRVGWRGAWPLGLGFYAIYALTLYVLMPPNPDPVRMPPELVRTFRAISLAGLLLFWGVLAGVFGWLSRERASGAWQRSGSW